MNENKLSIGTVVRLDDANLVMIIGYSMERYGTKYDYIVCEYPSGVSASSKQINKSEIVEVVYNGYNSRIDEPKIQTAIQDTNNYTPIFDDRGTEILEMGNDVVTRDGTTVTGNNELKFGESSIVVDDEVKFRASNIEFNNDSVIIDERVM